MTTFWFSTDKRNGVFVTATTKATAKDFHDDGHTTRDDGNFTFVFDNRAGTSGFVRAADQDAANRAVADRTGCVNSSPAVPDFPATVKRCAAAWGVTFTSVHPKR